MFGESESESPRIPSPWDTLMSTPPTSNFVAGRACNPSLPLVVDRVPKLVPESDDGNVEYKLQLLNPSPGRFARLVTQLKWRILEGGGQAYYELGVADSGDLIGLSRDELEKSLETLEMMAGEIGASVIVVKEIEVPAGLAVLTRSCKESVSEEHDTPSSFSSAEGGYFSNASSTEAEMGTDLPLTPVFIMDSEAEDTVTQEEGTTFLLPQFDVEISSVFKPRPMKCREFNPIHNSYLFGGKNKRVKKFNPINPVQDVKPDFQAGNGAQKAQKALQRRLNRDKRREEKRKGLEPQATLVVEAPHMAAELVSSSPERDVLVECLKKLHVDVVDELLPIEDGNVDIQEDNNELFIAKSSFPSWPTFTSSESHLDVDPAEISGAIGLTSNYDAKGYKALIVEALVVRKMLHQEAFLDFEGFSIS